MSCMPFSSPSSDLSSISSLQPLPQLPSEIITFILSLAIVPGVKSSIDLLLVSRAFYSIGIQKFYQKVKIASFDAFLALVGCEVAVGPEWTWEVEEDELHRASNEWKRHRAERLQWVRSFSLTSTFSSDPAFASDPRLTFDPTLLPHLMAPNLLPQLQHLRLETSHAAGVYTSCDFLNDFFTPLTPLTLTSFHLTHACACAAHSNAFLRPTSLAVASPSAAFTFATGSDGYYCTRVCTSVKVIYLALRTLVDSAQRGRWGKKRNHDIAEKLLNGLDLQFEGLERVVVREMEVELDMQEVGRERSVSRDEKLFRIKVDEWKVRHEGVGRLVEIGEAPVSDF